MDSANSLSKLIRDYLEVAVGTDACDVSDEFESVIEVRSVHFHLFTVE